tara:strand:- start:174 stop:611 length:438 start_codon:yes stop_codon:yes gene_type:complete
MVLALWVLTGCTTLQTLSGTGIVKVLPHLLDEKGQHTNGPTLLHRDSYQAELGENLHRVRGWRADVNWFGKGEVTLRLELRSAKPDAQPITVERTVGSGIGRGHWSSIEIDSETYREFGRPEAWRVSLWRGKEMLDKEESFLPIQ